MSRPIDRNALFGNLAREMGFINEETWQRARQIGLSDTSRPLGEILVEHGDLAEKDRGLVDSAVEARLVSDLLLLDESSQTVILPIIASLDHTVININSDESKTASDPDQATLRYVADSKTGDNNRDQPAVGIRGSGFDVAADGLRFKVLRSHARGGLGEVFLALDRQFQREVALKEIQVKCADDLGCRTRFLLEAEITGRLEHPGIIPVYGLGYYADGRPYYAMRFVRGDSLAAAIKQFHDADADPRRDPGERVLSLRKLLRRFIDACNAIGYAHSRGVLHRDIKPANIMLGPFGETLVVDWGLAKIVHSDEQPPEAGMDSQHSGVGESLIETQSGAVMGTLAYMSPEQARGDNSALGPATDIYALGATLYQLLVGRPTIGSGHPREVLQRVLVGDFPRPQSVNPRVPPALDAICLRALAADPSGRYATARALADDVESWLADEPVQAWREPWRVRSARWMRRHRGLVTGTAAALVVASASLLVGVLFLAAANERIRTEQSRAERNFEQLHQASDELLDVTEQWLARLPENHEVQQELLHKGLQIYEQFLAQEPANVQAQAEMADTQQRVADIRRKLGQYDLAAKHSRLAVAEFSRLAAAFPADLNYRKKAAECNNWLGEALRLESRLTEAEAAYRVAISEQETLLSENADKLALAAQLARTWYNLGLLLGATDRSMEAEQAYQTAIHLLAGSGQALPDEPTYRQHLARCHINLGVLLKGTKRVAEADTEYLAAIELLSDLYGKFPKEAEYRYELATANMNRGNLLLENRTQPFLTGLDPLGLAEQAYQSAIGLLERLVAEFAGVPRYRKELANSLNGFGSVQQVAGRSAAARQAWESAREQLAALTRESPDVSEYQSALGLTAGNLALLLRRDDPAAARVLLVEAVAHQQQALHANPKHPAYRRFLFNHRQALARVLAALGHHAETAEQAEELPGLQPEDAQAWYRAADLTAQCIELARADSKLDEPERQAAISGYAARAFDLLRKAIEHGFQDQAQLEREPGFSSLQADPEFQKLRELLEVAEQE